MYGQRLSADQAPKPSGRTGPFAIGSVLAYGRPVGRGLLLAAAFSVALLALPSQSGAAPRGSLKQLDGKAGCVVSHPTRRCVRAPATRGGSVRLAPSPDGRAVYALGRNIVVLSRNRRTGALRQRGCTSIDGRVSRRSRRGACRRDPAVRSPVGGQVSPDRRHLYVADRRSQAILIFRRGRRGLLRRTGCVNRTGSGSCDPARGLRDAYDLTVSAGGRSVYAIAPDANALVVLRRDPASGRLSQPPGPAGCLSEPAIDGCAAGRALPVPIEVVISRDGRNVYVAASASSSSGLAEGGAVAAFVRDPSTGLLTQRPGAAGCAGAGAGCAPVRSLGSALSLALSSDGKSAYAFSYAANRTQGFAFTNLVSLGRRAADGALSQLAGPDGCNGDVGGCRGSNTFFGFGEVTLSSDGRSLYALTFDTLSVFSRNAATGALAQLGGRPGCLQGPQLPERRISRCSSRHRAFGGLTTSEVAPGGRHVYVSSDRGIAVFKRTR